MFSILQVFYCEILIYIEPDLKTFTVAFRLLFSLVLLIYNKFLRLRWAGFGPKLKRDSKYSVIYIARVSKHLL